MLKGDIQIAIYVHMRRGKYVLNRALVLYSISRLVHAECPPFGVEKCPLLGIVKSVRDMLFSPLYSFLECPLLGNLLHLQKKKKSTHE